MQVISRDEVDLPDEGDVEGIDYPPLITIQARYSQSYDKEYCELNIGGLNRKVTFKMSLNTPSMQHEAIPSPPLMSPDILDPSYTATLISCGKHYSLSLVRNPADKYIVQHHSHCVVRASCLRKGILLLFLELGRPSYVGLTCLIL